MSEEKPLHVRVAEALGMECVPRGGAPGMMSFVYIDARRQYLDGNCPRYDTDWSVTGPLVERLGITLTKSGDSESPTGEVWLACDAVPEYADFVERDESALIAVCNLILALHEQGKLERIA